MSLKNFIFLGSLNAKIEERAEQSGKF